jgi:Ca2+-binding RTX toxin-like protein
VSSSLFTRLLLVAAAILLGAQRASAGYTAVVNGSVLQVTGDNKSDKLALRLEPGGTMLDVDVKNDGTADFTFDRSLFTSISIAAGGGNDTVVIDESGGQFTDESIVIDGGAGKDTLIGGSGADIIIGGDGDDFVDPKRGNDLVLLGAGDDVVVWHPGDGSDVIEGQAGDDTLEFTGANASENFDLSANGGRIRLFRDVANIVMDVNDVEHLDLATLGGADTVNVNDLKGTDMVRVNVDLAGASDPNAGDSQADSVVLHGSGGFEVVSIGATKGVLEVEGLSAAVRVAHAEPASDRVQYVVLGNDDVHLLGTNKADVISIAPSPVTGVRTTVDTFPAPVDVSGGGRLVVFGLSGADTISAANGINALGTSLELDGGSGNDVITGGDGDDILIGGSGNDLVSGGRGADLLLLGSGSDTAIWQPGDGSDTIEGQQGNDTLDFRASNVSENIDISPNGRRARLFRNVGNVTMDMNGVEQVSVAALGGVDTLVVNDLTGTDIKGVTLDLEGAAGSGVSDGQLDSIVVNGTPAADKMTIAANSKGVSVARKPGAVRVEHADLTDTLTVNGLAGVDKIQASPNVSSAISLTINED